jgi:hypothetical protein
MECRRKEEYARILGGLGFTDGYPDMNMNI